MIDSKQLQEAIKPIKDMLNMGLQTEYDKQCFLEEWEIQLEDIEDKTDIFYNTLSLEDKILMVAMRKTYYDDLLNTAKEVFGE